MNLHFSCNIQMGGSEFGVNNMKHGSILPCIMVQAGDGVGDIVLAHFVLLRTT